MYDISTHMANGHMEAVCGKVGCCDMSTRSHIGLENLQFCVVSLVTLQISTFEHLATHVYRRQCFKILISFAFLVQKDFIYPNYVSNT